MQAQIWGGKSRSDGKRQRDGKRRRNGAVWSVSLRWILTLLHSRHTWSGLWATWAAPAPYSSAMLSSAHTRCLANMLRLNTHKLYAAGRQSICTQTSYMTPNPKSSSRAKCITTESLRLVRESACDGPPVDYWGEKNEMHWKLWVYDAWFSLKTPHKNISTLILLQFFPFMSFSPHRPNHHQRLYNIY